MYKNLERIRKNKKLTIEDMGKLIGKSPANYYKKEMGSVIFTLKEAMIIAGFLHRDISFLFKEEEK